MTDQQHRQDNAPHSGVALHAVETQRYFRDNCGTASFFLCFRDGRRSWNKPTSPNTIKHFISNTNQSLSLNSSFPNKRLSRYKPTFSVQTIVLSLSSFSQHHHYHHLSSTTSYSAPRISYKPTFSRIHPPRFCRFAVLNNNTNQRSLGADPSESLSPPICFLRRNTSALQQLSSSSSVEA